MLAAQLEAAVVALGLPSAAARATAVTLPEEAAALPLDEQLKALKASALALAEAVKSGKVQPGDVIACAGFGAGLSWGAAVIRWAYEFAG